MDKFSFANKDFKKRISLIGQVSSTPSANYGNVIKKYTTIHSSSGTTFIPTTYAHSNKDIKPTPTERELTAPTCGLKPHIYGSQSLNAGGKAPNIPNQVDIKPIDGMIASSDPIKKPDGLINPYVKETIQEDASGVSTSMVTLSTIFPYIAAGISLFFIYKLMTKPSVSMQNPSDI